MSPPDCNQKEIIAKATSQDQNTNDNVEEFGQIADDKTDEMY